jgi:hypothetical protein
MDRGLPVKRSELRENPQHNSALFQRVVTMKVTMGLRAFAATL